MPEPEDPITQLAEAAMSLHEMFTAYVGAGFTDNQALYLVGQLVAGAHRGPTG
ncbi:hypothetical protein [Streptosporangium sp. CA-115845]|uniref:hypothetical protein n=1 Tax=Streptosporangium sp. CA-115845 TaxID=3240071 RepID=UPI003D8CC70E